MNTNYDTNYDTPCTRRRRIATGAAIVLLTAGELTAGALMLAMPAKANGDTYVAIAFSTYNDTGATQDTAPSIQAAEAGAVSTCDKRGGNHCVVVASAKNGCAAMAVIERPNTTFDDVAGASGPTRFFAENLALAKNRGGVILESACTTDPD